MEEQLNATGLPETKTTGPALAFPGVEGELGRLVYRREAARYLGISLKTCRRYEEAGLITPYKNRVNGRVFYSEAQVLALLGSKLKQDRHVLLYCRAAVLGSPGSNYPSAPDRLKAQVDRMGAYCVGAGIRVDEVISEIGPGTGSARLIGLDRLMEAVLRKEVSLIVVETEDRLARWGMGTILKQFLAWHGVELHVASPKITREEYREELKGDLAQLLYESKVILGETH